MVDVVESGPILAIYGVERWRLIDLVQWLYEEIAVSLDVTTVSHELKKPSYLQLIARPRHHVQTEHTLEADKKATVRISMCGRAVEHYAAMALMKRSPTMTANRAPSTGSVHAW